MGCVRPPRDGELGGAPPLSPKKRLRFRRKHKGRKGKKAADGERQRSLEPEDREEEEDEDEEGKAAATQTASDFNSRARTQISVPDHSRAIHSNTLSPGSTSTSGGGLLGSRIFDGTPKPSPAWRGVFCLPGEEDSVSAIIDVSSIPSQTTTTTPVNTAPALGSSTPGGGRVYRVREKVQGVLEKPWILRQKKEKKDKRREDKNEHRAEKEGGDGAAQVGTTPSETERKGVVHIREVDGKLCVVRTVYPSEYGSPVWRGERDGQEEVSREPPAPSPVRVEVSERDGSRAPIPAGEFPPPSHYLHIQEAAAAGGFKLESPACARDRSSLLESGYASDLPLTSPETAGTTPSQTDWGGLTSSSSERLDSTMESPLSLQHPAVRCLPQVCVSSSSQCVRRPVRAI